jgi:hypothetical protein
MKESTTYQAILREGLEEGRQEGRQEGTLAEAKRMLLLLGENRFGPPDARTRAVLDSIEDVGQLEEMSVRVQNVESWQDVLGRPTPRRRNSRSR